MRIEVLVKPGSKSGEVTRLSESGYKVRVDAPATKGKANIRLIEILADYFGIPKSSVRIIRGATGKSKIIEISGTPR